MNASALPSVTDRFARIMDDLRKAVAASIAARAIPGAMIILICARLGRISRQVQALAAQIRSGTLRTSPARMRRGERWPTVKPPPGALHLPRGFAWLVRLVGYQASHGSQLRYLLDDPEMAALIAATPRMRRALSPLCRMLGIKASVLAPRAAVPPEGPPPVDQTEEDTASAGAAPPPVDSRRHQDKLGGFRGEPREGAEIPLVQPDGAVTLRT